MGPDPNIQAVQIEVRALVRCVVSPKGVGAVSREPMSLMQLMKDKAQAVSDEGAEVKQYKSDLPPSSLSRNFVKETALVKHVDALAGTTPELLFPHEKVEAFLDEDNNAVPYHLQGDEDAGELEARDRAKRHPKVTRWIEALWGLFDTVRVALTLEGASIQQDQYFGAYLRMYKALVPPQHFVLLEARAAVGRDWRRDIDCPLVDRDYRKDKKKKRLKEFFMDESSKESRARDAKEWSVRRDELEQDAKVWATIGEEQGEGGHPDSPSRSAAGGGQAGGAADGVRIVVPRSLNRRSSWRSALRGVPTEASSPGRVSGQQMSPSGGGDGGAGGGAGAAASEAITPTAAGGLLSALGARKGSGSAALLTAGAAAAQGAVAAGASAAVAKSSGEANAVRVAASGAVSSAGVKASSPRKASALWKLAARVAAADAGQDVSAVEMGPDGLPVVQRPAAKTMFDRAQFFESMRELADVWSLGTDPSEYARFLKRIFFRVTEKAPKSGKRRWAGLKAIIGGGFGHPGDKNHDTAEAEAAELSAESDASTESSFYDTAGSCDSDDGSGGARVVGARRRMKRGARARAAAATGQAGDAEAGEGGGGAERDSGGRSTARVRGHVEYVDAKGRRRRGAARVAGDGGDAIDDAGDGDMGTLRAPRGGDGNVGAAGAAAGGEAVGGRDRRGLAAVGPGGVPGACGVGEGGDEPSGGPSQANPVRGGRRGSTGTVEGAGGNPWWFDRFKAERVGGEAPAAERSGPLARPVRQRGPVVPVHHQGPTEALTVTRRSSLSMATAPLPAGAARRLSTCILTKTTTDAAHLSLSRSGNALALVKAEQNPNPNPKVDHAMSTIADPDRPRRAAEGAQGNPGAATRRSVKLTRQPSKKGSVQ